MGKPTFQLPHCVRRRGVWLSGQQNENAAHRATPGFDPMMGRLTFGTKINEFVLLRSISLTRQATHWLFICVRRRGKLRRYVVGSDFRVKRKTNPRRWANRLSNCHVAYNGGASDFLNNMNENAAHRATPTLDPNVDRRVFGTKNESVRRRGTSFLRQIRVVSVRFCLLSPPPPTPTCVRVRVLGQQTNPRMGINNPSGRQITCGGNASHFLGNKKRNRWPSGDTGLDANGRWVAALSERNYLSVRGRCTSSTRQTMVCPFGCFRKVVGANSAGLDFAPICWQTTIQNPRL